MLGQPHYGAQGEVIKIDPEHKGRIQLKFQIGQEPDLSGVMMKQSRNNENYMPGESGVTWSRWHRNDFIIES